METNGTMGSIFEPGFSTPEQSLFSFSENDQVRYAEQQESSDVYAGQSSEEPAGQSSEEESEAETCNVLGKEDEKNDSEKKMKDAKEAAKPKEAAKAEGAAKDAKKSSKESSMSSKDVPSSSKSHRHRSEESDKKKNDEQSTSSASEEELFKHKRRYFRLDTKEIVCMECGFNITTQLLWRAFRGRIEDHLRKKHRVQTKPMTAFVLVFYTTSDTTPQKLTKKEILQTFTSTDNRKPDDTLAHDIILCSIESAHIEMNCPEPTTTSEEIATSSANYDLDDIISPSHSTNNRLDFVGGRSKARTKAMIERDRQVEDPIIPLESVPSSKTLSKTEQESLATHVRMGCDKKCCEQKK